MSDTIKIEDKTLFFSGDVSLVDDRDRIVAVVGARSASSWGLKAAARIGKRLAQAGFIVCNGLAAGIDTAAVEGALSSDGRVIAVLPGSLDNVYPKANAGLAARIIEGGGLLISEHDSGHQLDKTDFISRDDVQAMLSSRCVVVECSENGGTMHTVEFAEKYGKQVYCFNQPQKFLSEPKTQGNQKLIREGVAKPIYSKEELKALISAIITAPIITKPNQHQPEQLSLL